MDINYLYEYIVLAKILNFSKAADFLYISQPTLCRHLVALEEEVGSHLFIRTKHTFELTDLGKEFLKDAIKIVEHYDKAIEKINSAHTGFDRTGGLYYQKELMLPKIERFIGRGENEGRIYERVYCFSRKFEFYCNGQ